MRAFRKGVLRSMKFVRSSLLVKLVILILVGVMTVQVIRVYGRVSDARTQEAQIAAQVEQRKQENAALEADLGKSDDEEFVKDLARDQLGLAESGERIFYDVNH